jgi:hypothetical protein
VYSIIGYSIENRDNALYVKGYSKEWKVDSKIKACNKVIAFRLGMKNVKMEKKDQEYYIYYDDDKSSVFNSSMSNALSESGLLF